VPCETVQATGDGDSADDGDGPGGSTEGGALVADQGSEFVATTGGGGSAGGGVGAGDEVGTAIGDGGSGGGAGDEAGGEMSPGTAVGDGGGGSGAGGKVGADGHSVGYGIVSEMTDTKSRVGDDGDGVGVETATEGGGVDAVQQLAASLAARRSIAALSASLRAPRQVRLFSQLRTARCWHDDGGVDFSLVTRTGHKWITASYL